MCVKITVKPTESGSICLQSSLSLGVHSNCVVIRCHVCVVGGSFCIRRRHRRRRSSSSIRRLCCRRSAAATESVAVSAQLPPQQQQQQLQSPQARSPQCGGASLISKISHSLGEPHICAQVASLSSHVNPPFSHLSW